MQTELITSGNSKRLVHNFPENQILTLFVGIGSQEQPRSAADRSAVSPLLVALVEAKLWTRGTRADSCRVEIPNGTRNFRNFQFSGKEYNSERLIEILETNVRKPSVLFAFQPEFPRILVEWNAPVTIFCKDGRSVCFVLYIYFFIL